jgi:hypothetical protein
MDIAAFVLSVISLSLSLWTFIRFEAKERSTHQIQMIPVDELGRAVKLDDVKKNYREFDSPENLDEDEAEYFNRMEKIQ